MDAKGVRGSGMTPIRLENAFGAGIEGISRGKSHQKLRGRRRYR
jgi:hypothetical protein